MKLNVLFITFAIGLLTQSTQAAPLLGDVADVSSDRVDVPAGGVHVNEEGINVNGKGSLLNNKKRQETNLVGGAVSNAEKLVQDVVSSPEGVDAPLQGTGAFAQKTTSDLGVSQLTRRQLDGVTGNLRVVNDLAGSVESTLGSTGLLRKRYPLLDNKGDGYAGIAKRDESNDDDGDDVFKHYPPQGATYGSGMAASNPAAFADAMTKRDSEDEEGGDDDSHNGENTPDHPGRPPAGLTDEQLDDFYTKRDSM